MFILKGTIEIGDYSFPGVNEVEITKSVNLMSDTAVVKLPTKFKIRSLGLLSYTEEAIKVGDPVKITLGYQDKYSGVEFEGFVKKISPKTPLEIHCEDAMWLLRRKNITKAWNSGATLKQVLEEIVSQTPLQIADNIPEIHMKKYIIKNANGTQVLQAIKKKMGMTIFLDDDGKLYCGLQQLTNIGQEASYDLNYSLVENSLEFKTEEERRLKIRYTYIDPQNKKKTVEVGDFDGELRTFHTSIISDQKQLKEMASAELKKLKYEGYEGSITTFLIPYVTRGMKANLIDEDHKNREGSYFVKEVVTTYGMEGARRQVTIGTKI